MGDAQPVRDDPPPPAVDERALVNRARAGDQVALGQLYDLYADRIFRFAMAKLGNQSDAEDLTAEVFIRMIEALPRFEWRDVPFVAWLMRIASNQVSSHYRRVQTRPQRTPIEDMDFVDTQAGPESIVELKLSVDEVRETVKKLPEAQRQVIELRFFANLNVAETARALGKSENNVKVLQHKAIAKLQKLLAE